MSKRKLLLADDSITIQKVVNLTFADEGIEVITVGDGDSAMQKISEISPDVILADVHMPGLNGYQICEIVRDNPVTKHIPVVLLVGSFEPFDEGEAARVGANAHLTKPFQSIRQLVTQVTELMESSSPVSETSQSADQDFHAASDDAIQESNDDIENLYQQSFNASGIDERESGSSHFVDAGMDDEMIDSRSMADAEKAEPTESSREGDYAPGGVEAVQLEDAQEVEPAESSREADYAPADFEAVELEAEPLAGSFEEPLDESGTDSSGDDTGDAQPFVDQFAATEPILPLTAQQYRADFDLDDIDLLELPPDENSKTLEFTTPQNLLALGGTKQVVSLSPELMETIVQKVVEKLSERQ